MLPLRLSGELREGQVVEGSAADEVFAGGGFVVLDFGDAQGGVGQEGAGEGELVDEPGLFLAGVAPQRRRLKSPPRAREGRFASDPVLGFWERRDDP